MTGAVYDEWDDENRAANVVFAIEKAHDGNRSDTAIIADITRDDAWIASNLGDAASLDAWR